MLFIGVSSFPGKGKLGRFRPPFLKKIEKIVGAVREPPLLIYTLLALPRKQVAGMRLRQRISRPYPNTNSMKSAPSTGFSVYGVISVKPIER